jgi:Ca2+-dependent lipid-binding protein
VKTSTIKHKTAHAKWNDEKFTFLVTDRESQIVTITVFDHDRFSKNDPLARQALSLVLHFPSSCVMVYLQASGRALHLGRAGVALLSCN